MNSGLDDALTRHLDELADKAPALGNESISEGRRRGERLRRRRALGLAGGTAFAFVVAAAAINITGASDGPGPDRPSATNPGVAASHGEAISKSIPMPVVPNNAVREVERYSTVEEAAQAANVSIVGTVTSIHRGDSFVTSEGGEVSRDQFLVLNVLVDQVLTGKVNDGTTNVRVEVGPYPSRDLDLDQHLDLVGRQSIYLLRLKGSEIPGVRNSDPQELARNAYRVVNSQAVFDRAPSGTVRAPWAGYPLEGMSFDDLVAQIDAAA